MKRKALLTVLIGLLLVGLASFLMNRGTSTTSAHDAWWIGFLILMPVGLAVLVWQELRWAAMACVIYGTVGLALDLATTVQILTKDSHVLRPLMSNVASGLLNFLLIMFGGRSFLDVTRALLPLESRPPRPPSHF